MKRIEITADRLTLKPLGIEYLSTVNEYALNRENTKYMINLPNETDEETAEFLRRIDFEWEKECPEFFEFAVVLNNRHIGAVSIYIENGVGEIGWIVNKKYWGKGYAFEAAKALVEYFSKNMKISHFVAHCDAENIASYKVMEKLGMIKTGEWGGRRNKLSDAESFEYKYELTI